MMTSSDIIAIVAVVVSAIVSILSIYISYRNNKITLLAKRTEMVFGNQLEAFREFNEVIGELTLALRTIESIYSRKHSKLESSKALGDIVSRMENIVRTYSKNIAYFPPDVAENIALLSTNLNTNIENFRTAPNAETLKKIRRSIHDDGNPIVEKMREYLNVK